MSIEIRPHAVREQADKKFRELMAMVDTLEYARDALRGFTGSQGELKGSGYDAARSHIAQYDLLVNSMLRAVRAVRDTDSRVYAALGVFQSSRVSEQEWLDKKADAERRLRAIRAEARALAASQPPIAAGLQCEMLALASQERQACKDLDYAGRMLSKIYDYCAKTNSLYEGAVHQLVSMASSGMLRFATCRFSISNGIGVWDTVDQSLWFDQGVYDSYMDLLGQKEFGDVREVGLATVPTVAGFAHWWDQNGNWAQAGLGLFGIASAIVALVVGGGFIAAGAALVGITIGSMDVASGIAGTLTGKNIDWRGKADRGVSTTFGPNADKAKCVIAAVEMGAAVYNVSKLPLIANKALKSPGAFSGFSKSVDSVDSVIQEVESYKKLSFKSSPLLEGKQANAAEFANDAEDLRKGVEGVGDISGKAMDEIEGKRKRGESSYADASFVALGYDY